MNTLLGRFLNHRIYLNITFSATGRALSLAPKTSHLTFLALLVVGGVYGYFQHTKPQETMVAGHSVIGSQEQLSSLNTEVKSLQEDNEFKERQLKAYAQELGVLESRLERFDSITEKLMDDKNVGKRLKADIKEIDGKGSVATPELTLENIDNMDERIAGLQDRADDIEAVLQSTMNFVTQGQVRSKQQPHLWPTVNHRTYLSSRYGWRKNPFAKTKRQWHAGVDIAGGMGAPIVTAANGLVTFAGYRYGYGLMVEVKHEGDVYTRYAHLKSTIAKNGDVVKAGDVVALMGSTGRSTGPHLHLEVLVSGQKVDPLPFIKGKWREARKIARANVDPRYTKYLTKNKVAKK